MDVRQPDPQQRERLQEARLLEAAGLSCLATRSLFYFPRLLAVFRPLEPMLARLPLGAQYYVLAQKPAEN